jgi:hypothetical protein
MNMTDAADFYLVKVDLSDPSRSGVPRSNARDKEMEMFPAISSHSSQRDFVWVRRRDGPAQQQVLLRCVSRRWKSTRLGSQQMSRGFVLVAGDDTEGKRSCSRVYRIGV